MVSERKQIYKCFGCGKAGNVITFIMEYEKISFIETLKKLAARAGITIKETKADPKKKTRKDLIYKIYSLTTSFYKENLQKHGQFVLEYLKKREITEETVAKFDIGYALDSYGGLKNYLLKNSINEKILEHTGLFSKSEKGIFDTFRNRLMFPIHSITGKVIAFGGRVLQDDQSGGKYINSPTTEIYTKGNELYGLFVTKHEIQKRDFALVCEGYTDFLRLYENGFTNSVASLGTSITDAQINLLSRFTKNIFIIYDGDIAGRKAAVRAAGNVIKKGYNTKIVVLPEKEDPDNFLVNSGKEKLQEKIENAKLLPIFLLEDDLMGLENRGKLDLLLEIVNEIDDKITREFFVKEIADDFKISETSIFSKIKFSQYRKRNVPVRADILQFPEERNLLKSVLNEKYLLKKVAQEINSSYFFLKIYKNIYEEIIKYVKNSEHISGLLNQIEDEIIKNTIGELLIEDVPNISIDEILKAMKLRKYQKDLQDINQQMVNEGSNKELLDKKNKLKKEILNMNSKIVRKTLY
jgi:DNA primase